MPHPSETAGHRHCECGAAAEGSPGKFALSFLSFLTLLMLCIEALLRLNSGLVLIRIPSCHISTRPSRPTWRTWSSRWMRARSGRWSFTLIPTQSNGIRTEINKVKLSCHFVLCRAWSPGCATGWFSRWPSRSLQPPHLSQVTVTFFPLHLVFSWCSYPDCSDWQTILKWPIYITTNLQLILNAVLFLEIFSQDTSSLVQLTVVIPLPCPLWAHCHATYLFRHSAFSQSLVLVLI